jgi:hypothetical protein
MTSGKFWIAVLVAGVVINIVDFLVQGIWLTSAIYSLHTETFNPDASPVWFIAGDFVAILVLAWVYDKVYGSFGGGAGGGALYGFYAGVLVNFPTWIFVHIFIKGFSYGVAWIWILYGVVWTVIAGAIIGALYKKGSASAVKSI